MIFSNTIKMSLKHIFGTSPELFPTYLYRYIFVKAQKKQETLGRCSKKYDYNTKTNN